MLTLTNGLSNMLLYLEVRPGGPLDFIVIFSFADKSDGKIITICQILYLVTSSYLEHYSHGLTHH